MGLDVKRFESFTVKPAFNDKFSENLFFSKTWSAISTEDKLPRRVRTLCCSRLSLVFLIFLLFSFFLLDFADFGKHEAKGNLRARLMCVVLNLLDADCNSSCKAMTCLLAPSRYCSSLLAKGLRVLSSKNRLLLLLSMSDFKSPAEFKVILTVLTQDSHLETSLLLKGTAPVMNLFMFWHTPYLSFFNKFFAVF